MHERLQGEMSTLHEHTFGYRLHQIVEGEVQVYG